MYYFEYPWSNLIFVNISHALKLTRMNPKAYAIMPDDIDDLIMRKNFLFDLSLF